MKSVHVSTTLFIVLHHFPRENFIFQSISSASELPNSPRRPSALLEMDNTNNPRPTSGSEIDDLARADNSGPTGIDNVLFHPGSSRRPSVVSLPNSGIYSTAHTDLASIPDINVYQQKKIIAQGMMDLALISANASQFRYVLQSKGKHPYYYTSLSMISLSLFFQLVVALGLIWNCRFDVNDNTHLCRANKANNLVVVGVFMVTVLNVFISSFSILDVTEGA